jgi:hypothetical protein
VIPGWLGFFDTVRRSWVGIKYIQLRRQNSIKSRVRQINFRNFSKWGEREVARMSFIREVDVIAQPRGPPQRLPNEGGRPPSQLNKMKIFKILRGRKERKGEMKTLSACDLPLKTWTWLMKLLKGVTLETCFLKKLLFADLQWPVKNLHQKIAVECRVGHNQVKAEVCRDRTK